MDGQTFLVKGSQAQDSTLGYADRFDEKYELLRSIRIGDWKYIRSYQPFYPDGMQNNYRYIMLAYREWRELYERGELSKEQSAFFEPKSAERLYDLSVDPSETNDLSADSSQSEKLLEMRSALTGKLKEMPDLGFFPEPFLVENALASPVAFGQSNKARIANLIDTADLMLLPYAEAEPGLNAALKSDDEVVRYWAVTCCVAFGKQAEPLGELVTELLEDESFSVRMRSIEFLSLLGDFDPVPAFENLVNGTENPVEHLFALNSVVFLRDHTDGEFKFDAEAFSTVKDADEANRRITYLRGDWLESKKKKSSKK